MSELVFKTSLTKRISWSLFVGIEIVAWLLALSPFVMCGPGFVVTTTDIVLPQLCLFSVHNPVYEVATVPLEFLGLIYPMVYFDGEGVARVRPFMILVFWGLMGLILSDIHFNIRRRRQKRQREQAGAAA